MTPRHPVLTFNNLGLQGSLGGHWQVQGLSGQVNAGELLLVTGAPGSGKTTLLRLFDGLVSPSIGELRWWGQTLAQVGPARLHRRVAWVSGTPRLLGQTVRETLAYPLALQHQASSQSEPRLAEICQQFLIPENWLDRSQDQLSPGEALWVTIARAWTLKPELLLLDDVLPCLTPDQQTQLRTWLKPLINQGLTLIASGQPQPWRELTTATSQLLILGPQQRAQPMGSIDWDQVVPEALIDEDWD